MRCDAAGGPVIATGRRRTSEKQHPIVFVSQNVKRACANCLAARALPSCAPGRTLCDKHFRPLFARNLWFHSHFGSCHTPPVATANSARGTAADVDASDTFDDGAANLDTDDELEADGIQEYAVFLFGRLSCHGVCPQLRNELAVNYSLRAPRMHSPVTAAIVQCNSFHSQRGSTNTVGPTGTCE